MQETGVINVTDKNHYRTARRSNQETGGIKINDLNLFREASHARSVNVVSTGGDVFITSAMSSDTAVLWGENFGAKERKFLRELLTTEMVCFSLEDTYQMHCRTLWHASAITNGSSKFAGGRRKGKFVLLLHDLTGELTTSWTFAKFIRPIYRQKFSVIAADLPGYGKSSVAQVCSCPISKWQPWSAHIVAKIMEELGISKCHMLAVGHSAGVLMQIMLNSPHRIEGRHVIVNPIFDRNQLFGHVGSDLEPPPGAKPGWRQEIKERQMAEFVTMVRTAGVQLWFIFDREGKHKNILSGMKAPNRQTQIEWEQAYDTHEFLVNACEDEFASMNVTMTMVTSSDLCEAQCGKKVPVRMLVPSRHLKSSVARFLADHWNLPWQESYMPKNVLNDLKDPKKMSEVFGIDVSDDSDSEPQENISSRRGARRTVSRHGTSSPPLPSPSSRDSSRNGAIVPSSLNGAIQTLQKSSSAPGNLRAIECDLTSPQRNASTLGNSIRFASESIVEPSALLGMKGTSTRTVSESLVTPPIARRPRDSTLGSAALVAKERLRKSGALDKQGPVSGLVRKEKKMMDFSGVPFEQDLSYGVRKMYMDAFETSVDTYRDEQLKEMEQQEKKRNRSAFRAANRKGRTTDL